MYSIYLVILFISRNNPSAVQKHLGKLFDSMNALKFKMNGDKPTKIGTHMIAKDKEVVEFPRQCNMDGERDGQTDIVRWTDRQTDKPTKIGTHIIAKDKEVVEFPRQCNMVGERYGQTDIVRWKDTKDDQRKR